MRRRRHERRRLSIDRRRPHLRALDADAAAAHFWPGRTRRRALPRRQELQRRLGAGDVARRGRDHHSRCPATKTSAASSRARWTSAAISATWSRRRRCGPTTCAPARCWTQAPPRVRMPLRGSPGGRCARARRRALGLLVARRARGAPPTAPSRMTRAESRRRSARQSTALRCKFGFLLHTLLQTAHPYKAGPIAQRSELAAHNRLVPGSNPGGPTRLAPPDRRRRSSKTWHRNARRNRNCAISLSDSRNFRDTTPRFRN